MKTTSYILCFLALYSCKSKDKSVLKDTISNNSVTASNTVKRQSAKVSFTPYKFNEDYTIIDTGKYSNDGPMTGGSYAIVKNNRESIDTIDLYYGIKELGHHTYFYHKLNHEIDPTEKDSKGVLMLLEEKFFLITNNNKSSFDNLTSNFDDYFSDPNVINQKIFFWKLEKIDTIGTLKVSAAEFDPLTDKTKSYFLLNDVLETDDSNHFPLPYLEKDNIVFSMDGKKKWLFSTEFNPY